MTRRRLVDYRCPRCGGSFREYEHHTSVTHECQPPGRPAKTVELQRIDNDEEDMT